MTTTLPVVFPDPPFERRHPRVTVVRHDGCVNAGDGLRSRFVVRFVVDCETQLLVDASTASAAARRAAALVRTHRPRAVWLLDADPTRGGVYASASTWQSLARAASEVRAAFVAWTGRATAVCA